MATDVVVVVVAVALVVVVVVVVVVFQSPVHPMYFFVDFCTVGQGKLQERYQKG